MERFIRRENIKRFRKLLLEAKDDAERRRIQKLLIEEEQKESAAGTPSAFDRAHIRCSLSTLAGFDRQRL
jgi:hypothetical protein